MSKTQQSTPLTPSEFAAKGYRLTIRKVYSALWRRSIRQSRSEAIELKCSIVKRPSTWLNTLDETAYIFLLLFFSTSNDQMDIAVRSVIKRTTGRRSWNNGKATSDHCALPLNAHFPNCLRDEHRRAYFNPTPLLGDHRTKSAVRSITLALNT